MDAVADATPEGPDYAEAPQPGSNVERPDDGDGVSGGEPEPLPLSQRFEILSNGRRRRALRALRDCGGSSTLGEVAERVAAWENDKEPGELRSNERKRTYVGLYQCHLPKMDEAGVVTFDKYRGDVRLGPMAPLMFEYLDFERPRPWASYYLALVGFWGCLLLLGVAGGISVLTSTAAIAFQLLTFALCSLAHYQLTR